MHSVLKSNQIAQHVVSDVGKAKQNGTAGRQKIKPDLIFFSREKNKQT